MSTDLVISFVFAAFVVTSVVIRLVLMSRQVRQITQHRDRVPERFAAAIPLAAHQKAADYTLAKLKLALPEWLLEAVVLIAFTLGGGLQALQLEIAQSTALHAIFETLGVPAWLGESLALFAAVSLITSVIGIPFDLQRTFGIEARFGFNRSTLKLYIIDALKSLALSVVIGVPLLAAVLMLMNSAGPAWWFYTWLLWIVFNLTAMVLFPTVIAPMFNRFKPLEDGELRQVVENLLQRCGFSSRGVFVVDGSRRSSHGNAYFTGLGAAKRIVFYDTLLARLSPAQIEAVLAHELGHFKLGHIRKMMLTSFVLGFVLLAVLGWLTQQADFYRGLGVEPSLLQHPAAMALLLFSMALGPVLFPLRPLTSLMSRRHEYQADAFAAQHARANDLINALVKLYEDNANTLTPDPWYSKFYDSHPPASLRVAHLEQLAS